MPTRKKTETTALVGLVVQLICVGVTWLLFLRTGAEPWTRSLAVLAQTWFFAPGVLMWVVVFLHSRQRRLAAEEREEMEELRRARLSEELFEEQELDRMRAHNALLIFERFLVPALSIIFSGVLIYLACRSIWIAYAVERMPTVTEPIVVAIGTAFLAFLGFLVGRYAVGLAQNAEMRLLRAAGAYLLGNVLGSLILAFAMAMVHFGLTWPEVGAAFVIPGIMGLVGMEIILNLILDIYRPRVPGQEARPPYDSRLLGLIAEPGSMVKTLATTLDYQFGFKVSETWFYRFMARAIIPLLFIQITCLWLLSCLVVVDPHEVAFIERFGSPRLSAGDAARGLEASVFRPGYYLKLPWPFEVARRVPARRIFSMEIGKILYEEGEMPASSSKNIMWVGDPDTILWSEYHVDPKKGFEANFLVPSGGGLEAGEAPATNIARVEAYVCFRVKTKVGSDEVDEQAAYDFYYRHAEQWDQAQGQVSTVPRLVEDLSYGVMCRLAASQDFIRWVNVEREEVSRQFVQMLQEELDDHKAGVEVVYAGIPSVHPPAEVADGFEQVIKAYQEMETTVLEAQRDAIVTVNQAKGNAAVLVNEAEGYSVALAKLAGPAAARFQVQLDAYRKAPRVYRYRRYLSALEDVLKGHRLIVVPVSQKEVQIIDLEPKLRPGIGGIDIQETTKQ